MTEPLAYLRVASIIGGFFASACIGIALGCVIEGDRRQTGKLALGVSALFAASAAIFWWIS
jgi:cytochrome bd-type quinol oxidase subunit 2